MTETPEPQTTRDTSEIVSDLLVFAGNAHSESTHQLAAEAARRLDSLQTQLQLERDERAKLATEPVGIAREYTPSDHELRMTAVHAASPAGEQAPYVAKALYDFLADSPDKPTRGRYEIDMDQHDEHEDNAYTMLKCG